MNRFVQKEVNCIWSEVWEKGKKTPPHNIGGGRLFIEAYPVFKKYFLAGKGMKVLEVGGGTGRYGVKIAQDYPDSEVIISDILEDSLLIGKKLASYVNVSNVVFKIEDVLKMTFADNSFDMVFGDALIQHLPDYERAIKEMERVLRPGGRLIVSSVNYWNFHSLYKFFLKLLGKKYNYGYEKSFSRKELRSLIMKNNFKIIGEDGFYSAYGLYRLKYFGGGKFFDLFGRILNRIITKFIDPLTNRFLSRYFGFEIFIVAEKNYK